MGSLRGQTGEEAWGRGPDLALRAIPEPGEERLQLRGVHSVAASPFLLPLFPPGWRELSQHSTPGLSAPAPRGGDAA